LIRATVRKNSASMADEYADILRRHCSPLEPIPTGESPVLGPLSGVRAVLLDVYGTLFVSDSGEVGAAQQAAREAALREALTAMGTPLSGTISPAGPFYVRWIETAHEAGRRKGIDYPEIDILDLWRAMVDELVRLGSISSEGAAQIDLKRLAVEYEARANPCWPMPGLRECLGTLRARGITMGIVSNAQFYTPLLFDALLQAPAEKWGIDAGLQYYSYRHGRAKPGTALFQAAAEALRGRGIAPEEVLCVGNDMLNDVMPACAAGFRTALFAGDARSLRHRTDDARLEGVRPDLVLTQLAQLAECITID
jgi:putative hydrolase of the HAD superfamily